MGFAIASTRCATRGPTLKAAVARLPATAGVGLRQAVEQRDRGTRRHKLAAGSTSRHYTALARGARDPREAFTALFAAARTAGWCAWPPERAAASFARNPTRRRLRPAPSRDLASSRRHGRRRLADDEARLPPLYEALARQIAADEEILRFLPTPPKAKRQPNLLLAAVRRSAERRSTVAISTAPPGREPCGIMLERRTSPTSWHDAPLLLALMALSQPPA